MSILSASRIAQLILGISGILSPGLVSTAEQNGNALRMLSFSTENNLTIVQSPQGGHSADLTISRPDTLSTSENWAREIPSLLQPGVILQNGTGHHIDLTLGGSDNQIAIQQDGSSHQSSIYSQGTGNIVSVSQRGLGNSSAVSQSGQQNTVVISQTP